MLGRWFPSGIVSAPTAGQILVTTGPLSAGVYALTVAVSASVAAVVDVERLAQQNGGVVSTQRIYVAAAMGIPDLDIIDALADQDSLQVRNVTLIAMGTVSASIILRQLSSG